MNSETLQKARHFIDNEKQFHLGFLPTEQSNPLSAHMDQDFARSTVDGVRTLQRVDRNVAEMARRVLAGAEYAKLVEEGEKVIREGGRIVFSGCGATGRLSILLESMWREAALNSSYADSVYSIMTGGDYALVRSVEFFEDYAEFGRQQVRELNLNNRDMLVAITEGGETSSVLGTLDEALARGCKAFLLFNNPAGLLAERLERSRKAITDPRVCVLDLFCGPMALAGSTRMQATTSEQLIAGAALETIFCRLNQIPVIDYAASFEVLLNELEASGAVNAMAAYIDFEADTYRDNGRITYYADQFMLDIFTDTTERSPTFMLPPFRKNDDKVSPVPWAFVKNPLYPTNEVWNKSVMYRDLRCLEWFEADYRRMGAGEVIVNKLPMIQKAELLKFEVGSEIAAERCNQPHDAAVLVTVGKVDAKLVAAYDKTTAGFPVHKHLAIGTEISLTLPETPLKVMSHMGVKLVLNTISTGTMVCLGRVSGNWMSWVDVTNKKLLDRGIRLLTEIGKMSYEDAAMMLFESIDEVAATTPPGQAKPSAVQHALNKLKNK